MKCDFCGRVGVSRFRPFGFFAYENGDGWYCTNSQACVKRQTAQRLRASLPPSNVLRTPLEQIEKVLEE